MKLKKSLSVVIALCIVFSMALPVLATPDSYEPNNNMYDSVTIPAYYYPINATLDTSTDIDWYDFTAYGTGNLTLKLVPPSGKNYDFLVYYQGTLIAQGNTMGSGETERVTIPVTSGRTYVCMVASPNNDCSDSTYAFGKDTFTSTLDAAYEVNNSPQQAASISMYNGSPIGATIKDSNDVDYYVFTANNSDPLNIGLIPPSNKQYDIYVIDKVTSTLLGQATANGGSATYVNCNVISGREYYIIIAGHNTSTDFMSGVPYQLFKG